MPQTPKPGDNRPALPRHVEDAVQQIANIHREHKSEARPSEQLTDKAVSLMGTPTFFGICVAISATWIIYNQLAGTSALDPAPYAYLELASSLIAVLLAILILAAQRRDDRLATRREQMDLQVSLLTEQKVSKLIELVEELRRDLPSVQDRIDLDAIEMTAPADHTVALKKVEDETKPG